MVPKHYIHPVSFAIYKYEKWSMYRNFLLKNNLYVELCLSETRGRTEDLWPTVHVAIAHFTVLSCYSIPFHSVILIMLLRLSIWFCVCLVSSVSAWVTILSLVLSHLLQLICSNYVSCCPSVSLSICLGFPVLLPELPSCHSWCCRGCHIYSTDVC